MRLRVSSETCCKCYVLLIVPRSQVPMLLLSVRPIPWKGRAISRGRRSVILGACLVDVTGVPSDRSEQALAGLGMP